MRFEWPLRPLSDVARDITVGFVGTMADQYVDDGVPFLRSLNVRPLRIDSNDVKYISREFHDRLRKSSLRPGDVVIVRTGKPGTCAVIPETLPEANCSDVVIVRCGQELRPAFLAYWVNAMAASHVSAHTVGAVQQHFNVASAKLLRLPVPALQVQDTVLAPLMAMDRRIDLLRQTNATLESIAQALFKSWFIDFDPVRAKAEGREPESMDAATAALFPIEFEESALGLIPKGWRVSNLAEHVVAERGLSYKGAGLCEAGQGVPMHNLNSVREGGGYKYAGLKHYSGDFKDRHTVDGGEVIVANTEQGHEHRLIGFPAIIPMRYERAIFSHHIYRVRLRTR
jgi:type I restriction enzyme S subunit